MAAAVPFVAFVRYRFKRIGCLRRIKVNNIDLQKYCVEHDIESSAIKIDVSATYIYVISIYKSPTGDVANFIKGMDAILH